jgi:2-polyprenyl-3-methyl-5-hydroxy-6-metoxy-1,4-benzoquinol methylase
MTLISDEYRETLQRMHVEGKFGKSGGKWWAQVAQIIHGSKVRSWLDYGCGGGHLAKNVRKISFRQPVIMHEYDPGVYAKAFRPKLSSYDLVTCIDTLEHVEPDNLGQVLEDLNRLTKGVLFAVISVRAAGKDLPDGRNAHLIVEDGVWWQHKLTNRGKFIVVRMIPCAKDEWAAILKASP